MNNDSNNSDPSSKIQKLLLPLVFKRHFLTKLHIVWTVMEKGGELWLMSLLYDHWMKFDFGLE